MARAAVFLDRDGVLIQDVHLLTQLDKIEIMDGAPDAILRLRKAGFPVVVVTNQAVVARGLVAEKDVENAHTSIQQMLSKIGGAEVDRFYYCPHHPNANLPSYRVECDCRKPRPGLLLRAAREMGLELSKSYMVGDHLTDIAAGWQAGCQTILVGPGIHPEPAPHSTDPPRPWPEPDHRCADLVEAVNIILGTVR